MTENKKTSQEIQNWIKNWLSGEIGIPLDEIDSDESFSNLGVSSRQAVFFAGELEDWLGGESELDPSLAWDYPTISKLANHLGGEFCNG